MPSGMNARPRSPRRSSKGGGADMHEEGDRSAVACAARITALNISFISGPSNYRIPRTYGARKRRSAIVLTYIHAHTTRSIPRSLQAAAAITRGAASSAVNETHPRSCASLLFFSSPSFSPLRPLPFCVRLFLRSSSSCPSISSRQTDQY